MESASGVWKNLPLWSGDIYRRVLYLVVLFWVASASFFGFYANVHFFESRDAPDKQDLHYSWAVEPHRDFRAMIEGKANRPFVYRQFLYAVANEADRIIPEAVKRHATAFRDIAGRNLYQYLFDTTDARNPNYSFRYLVLYFETFLFAWAAGISTYMVCRQVGAAPPQALISATVLLLLIPYFGVKGGTEPYDYSELAFMALAVFSARRYAWWALIPIVLLGTWNKESFLLMVIALYPFLLSRYKLLQALLAEAVLGCASVAVYLLLRQRYQGNPGGTTELHFFDQIAAFSHLSSWTVNASKIYGVIVPNATTIIPIVLVAWTVKRAWKRLPRDFQIHAIIAAILSFPLYILFANPAEVRDLSLLYVFMAVCASLGQENVTNGAPAAGNHRAHQGENAWIKEQRAEQQAAAP